MLKEFVSWMSVLLILAASGVMLTSHNWRVHLGALAAQYLSTFWLVAQHQPFIIGSVKLVTGWMVVAALGMTRLNMTQNEEFEISNVQSSRSFSIVLVSIIAIVIAGATPRIEAAIPGLGLQVIAGGLVLVSAGLIHLGITSDPMRAVMGLLSLLAGFEILYASVESSVLVTGLLAIVTLGLGLAGSYLLIAGASLNVDETTGGQL